MKPSPESEAVAADSSLFARIVQRLTAPSNHGSRRRFARLVPALLVLGLLIHLLSEQLWIAPTRQLLGPVSVVVALTPSPPPPGPVLLHVQINSPDDLRPVQNGRVQAWQLIQGETRPLSVNTKAVMGAADVSLMLNGDEAAKVVVEVSAMSPIGRITYEIRAGERRAQVLNVEYLDPATGKSIPRPQP